jgi:hypothetical protein
MFIFPWCEIVSAHRSEIARTCRQPSRIIVSSNSRVNRTRRSCPNHDQDVFSDQRPSHRRQGGVKSRRLCTRDEKRLKEFADRLTKELDVSRDRAEVVPFLQSALGGAIRTYTRASDEVGVSSRNPATEAASKGEVNLTCRRCYGNSLSLIRLAYFIKLQWLRAGVLLSTRSRSLSIPLYH